MITEEEIDKEFIEISKRVAYFGEELSKEGKENLIIISAMLSVACTGLRAISTPEGFDDVLNNVLKLTEDVPEKYAKITSEDQEH